MHYISKRKIRNISIFLTFILLIFLLKTVYNITPFNKPVFQSDNGITVHYIDVGQGDCMLIQVNNKNLLIDSGPKDSKNKLAKYLKSCKLNKLDYVIATHPHDDHIGNMNYIINTYKIDNFYAPKVKTNTKTFEDMIYALKRKNLKINIIKKDTNNINLGNDTSVSVYSPVNETYENLNNYSPIIKIKYKNTSFLFTGDAEKEAEASVLNCDLKADVLKIGHHGSSSSSTPAFLKKVNPKIAVISDGKNNVYNHPSKTTLNNLNNMNIKILRTDLNGNIIIHSDGNNISYISA